MAIEVRLVENKEIWEHFMERHPESNFLHSWLWGEFQKSINHTVIRRGFYKRGTLVGVMLLVLEPARRGRHLLVPAGPIIDWKDIELVQAAVNEMKRVAREHSACFVRVRPQLISDGYSKNLFKYLGFRSAQMHLHAELTWQLDLSKSDDELLASMRKNTRYELKRSSKIGIEVTSSTDIAKLNSFYTIQLETAKRHGFIPFSKKFLVEQFKVFVEENKVLLYEAHHEGVLLAQAFVIFCGQEAAYHYGTGTEAGRRLPGAYAIQWEAIQEAKRRGMTRYNFWGVTKTNQTKHRFYGVSVFKRGFGGEEVAYLHAQDLVINKHKYMKNYAVEFVRKRTRHLK